MVVVAVTSSVEGKQPTFSFRDPGSKLAFGRCYTRTQRPICLFVAIALLGSVAVGATRTSVHVAVPAKGLHPSKTAARNSWRKSGQKAIAPQRVRQIQAALIRENYLKGRADGVWDQRTKTALARFQADNRWQSKVVPDSRALIKLGLGPDHRGLINPETAAISFVLIPGGGIPAPSTLSHR